MWQGKSFQYFVVWQASIVDAIAFVVVGQAAGEGQSQGSWRVWMEVGARGWAAEGRWTAEVQASGALSKPDEGDVL